MSINLSKTKDAEPWSGLLPEADYVIRVTDAEEGTSRGGHDQYTFDLEVITGDHKGATLKDWVIVNQNTAGRVMQILNAFGVEIPDDGQVPASRFIGGVARITVRHREWDGVPRTNITAYNPGPEGMQQSERPDSSNGGAKPDDGIPFAFPELPTERLGHSWNHFA